MRNKICMMYFSEWDRHKTTLIVNWHDNRSFGMVVPSFVELRDWMLMAGKDLWVTGSSAFPFPEITNSMEQNHWQADNCSVNIPHLLCNPKAQCSPDPVPTRFMECNPELRTSKVWPAFSKVFCSSVVCAVCNF